MTTRLSRRFSLDFNVDSSFVEVDSCQIPNPSQQLTVVGVYSSPTSPEADNEQILRAVRLVTNQPGVCLIIGDFNATHINWQTGSCLVSSGFSMRLFEIAEVEFLFQTIKPPTRLREGNNPPILDQAFMKYPDDVSLMQMLATLGKRDRPCIAITMIEPP